MLEEVRDESCKLINAFIRVDWERILSYWQQIVGKLLVDLQIRKSLADGEGARKYYEALTEPHPGWEGELRDLVLVKKQVSSIYGPNLVYYVYHNNSASYLVFTAAQDLRSTEYLRSGWGSATEGV